jgi:hypothetical protein
VRMPCDLGFAAKVTGENDLPVWTTRGTGRAAKRPPSPCSTGTRFATSYHASLPAAVAGGGGFHRCRPGRIPWVPWPPWPRPRPLPPLLRRLRGSRIVRGAAQRPGHGAPGRRPPDYQRQGIGPPGRSGVASDSNRRCRFPLRRAENQADDRAHHRHNHGSDIGVVEWPDLAALAHGDPFVLM